MKYIIKLTPADVETLRDVIIEKVRELDQAYETAALQRERAQIKRQRAAILPIWQQITEGFTEYTTD